MCLFGTFVVDVDWETDRREGERARERLLTRLAKSSEAVYGGLKECAEPGDGSERKRKRGWRDRA